MHASSSQLYAVCKAAVDRGVFCECPEDEVICNQHGQQILHGAMGVDKYKARNGSTEHQVKFISILTPSMVYMRKLDGDSKFLPQASFLSNLVLHEDDLIWTDA